MARRSDARHVDDFDEVAGADVARLDDPAVQRDRSVELADDAIEDRGILLQGVGVERGHHAARACLADADQRRPDPQRAADPVALTEARNAGDQDVRTEPSVVDVDRADHAVREDRQGKDVVPLTAIRCREADELDVRSRCRPDHRERRSIPPGTTLDQRLSVGVERRTETEQARPVPRGDHPPARFAYVHEPIAGKSIKTHFDLLDRLAAQGFDGIPPECGNERRHETQ